MGAAVRSDACAAVAASWSSASTVSASGGSMPRRAAKSAIHSSRVMQRLPAVSGAGHGQHRGPGAPGRASARAGESVQLCNGLAASSVAGVSGHHEAPPEFDRATAVRLRHAGGDDGSAVHDVDVDPGWTIGDKPNGGYLLATMARA